MTMKEPSLIHANRTIDHEISAKRIISSWEIRTALLSQYGLPNMENLWLLLVKATLCKWEDLRLPIESVASQIEQPVAIAKRLVNILADAKLISISNAPTTETEIKITPIGEEMVIHGLQIEQSLDDGAEPIAIPLPR